VLCGRRMLCGGDVLVFLIGCFMEMPCEGLFFPWGISRVVYVISWVVSFRPLSGVVLEGGIDLLLFLLFFGLYSVAFFFL